MMWWLILLALWQQWAGEQSNALLFAVIAVAVASQDRHPLQLRQKLRAAIDARHQQKLSERTEYRMNEPPVDY